MIYILCPANLQTGGPEVLHQLGYKLNLLGVDAQMFYYNRQEGIDPVCECYRKYNVQYSSKLEFDENATVIIPEGGISLIHQLKNCRIVIWWLSVDYAKYTDKDVEFMRDNSNIYHLVQSQYALEHLHNNLKLDKNIYFLSDYLNNAFFDPTVEVDDDLRENIVLFNPKKGINKTATLIMSSDHRIKWQALYGLTAAGMRETMRKAKVYIDFGEHPGKDRIPREAAMCGCCVITNKKGAAANDLDVEIPDKYKFGDDVPLAQIYECINGIFENYGDKKKDYVSYINKISGEFKEFEKDIVKFFRMFESNIRIDLESEDKYIECILSEIRNENYGKALLYLVNYRIKGYEENVTIDIVETVIRMGICEFAEAEICAFRGLKKAPDNYELYLDLAQIGLLTGDMDKCNKYARIAIEYSQGTKDEEYVADMIKTFEVW